MNNMSEKEFENQIMEIASKYPYPETPVISSAVTEYARRISEKNHRPRKGWTWAASTALIILLYGFLITLSVPSVRAHILEFLQVGAIRIFTSEPKNTLTSPFQEQSFYSSLDDLAGETTLSLAQNKVSFSILLPSYPPEIGSPDRVFVQDFGGEAVLLIWTTSKDLTDISLALLILGPGTIIDKTTPEIVMYTSVRSQPALWTQGQHYLQIKGGEYRNVSLIVEGNILIWEKDGVTYRLETDLSLEEAVKIAESLK